MTLTKNLQNFNKKWYGIQDQNTDYAEENENGASIKFETKIIKSSLWDYSDVYILVTGDIIATGGDENTNVAFKKCTPFTKCVTHINEEHIDDSESINITISMYNLIEYINNYSDTSGSLWQFKKDKLPVMLLQITHHYSNTNRVF